MKNRFKILAFATTLVLGHVATAQAETLTSMAVLLINHANAPSDIVTAAQEHVSRIFLAAGVNVEWSVAGNMQHSVSDCRLRVILTAQPQDPRDRRMNVMGTAIIGSAGSGRLAYVFLREVEYYAGLTKTHPAVVLGHVMAHEMGHLLLGHPGHSVAGIMRAKWEPMEIARIREDLLTFTADEATTVRKGVLVR